MKIKGSEFMVIAVLMAALFAVLPSQAAEKTTYIGTETSTGASVEFGKMFCFGPEAYHTIQAGHHYGIYVAKDNK